MTTQNLKFLSKSCLIFELSLILHSQKLEKVLQNYQVRFSGKHGPSFQQHNSILTVFQFPTRTLDTYTTTIGNIIQAQFFEISFKELINHITEQLPSVDAWMNGRSIILIKLLQRDQQNHLTSAEGSSPQHYSWWSMVLFYVGLLSGKKSIIHTSRYAHVFMLYSC